MTLTFKLAYQSFCMTLQITMMHHHTKFGYKRFGGSDDIGQTNIHWHLETLIQISHKTLQLLTMYHKTKSDDKRISISKDTEGTVKFWLHNKSKCSDDSHSSATLKKIMLVMSLNYTPVTQSILCLIFSVHVRTMTFKLQWTKKKLKNYHLPAS